MLSDHPVYATLPTADLASLRRFYEDVLGFTVKSETPAGIYFQAGNGTYFAITRSSGRPSGSHTQMGFEITNIEDEVAALRARGAVFEEYETPKAVDGIADVAVGRAAWLRDPDGNLIGMIEFKQASLLVADRERREELAAGPRIAIALGSITDLEVDAIVNAANSSLQGGAGVDGAIHRAAGPGLANEARALAPCAPGDARITGGHRLKARHVIHTVGPMWAGGDQGEPETLASCYRRSLALAEEAGVTSLAIPAISTGIYGYPAAKAASVAVREVAMWLDQHELPETVILSAFSADAAMVLRRAMSDLARPDLTGS
jgi:O-acetyl-ADP-ribose deacetylase (regulator of RNase III)/catechol 2,3-dioxygenase-like lactoylglutathione lyase family enzyme